MAAADPACDRSAQAPGDETVALRQVRELTRRLEEDRILFKQTNILYGKFHVKDRVFEYAPEAAALFGVPERCADFPEQFIKDGRVVADVPRFVDFHKAIERGEPSGSVNAEIRIADGEIRLYNGHFTTVFDENGKPDYGLVSLIDITEQREQKLAYEKWRYINQSQKIESAHYYDYNLTNDVLETIDGYTNSIYPEQNERTFTGVADYVANNIIHPDDRAEYLRVFNREALIRRFHEGDAEVVTEHRRLGSDGKYYRGQGVIQMFRDPFNGDVLCFVLIRNLDLALASMQRKMHAEAFNLLSDSIPGGIVFTYNRPGMPCYFINDGMLNFVGYTSEEFERDLQSEFLRLVHPDEREDVAAFADKAMRTGREFESKHRVLRKDGANGWMLFRGRSGVNPSGEAILIISLIDITEIISLNESLEQAFEKMRHKDREVATSNRKLEAALQISESGVWGMDLERGEINYDPMTGRILQLPQGQDISLDAFVDHLTRVDIGFKDSELHRAFLDLDAETMAAAFTADRRLAFPDGTLTYTHNAIKQIDDRHIVGTIRDVTNDITLANDLLAAKEAAETANRGKSLFLSKMSHEIRTPMNAILGLSDLLLVESMTEKQRDFVHDIRTASSSLLEIINDILDMSKIEAGKLELHPVNFNLHELIANIKSMFAHAAGKKNVEFIVQESDDIPEIVHGDEIRLRQILVNLLSNAVKFTERGHIKLSVAQSDGLFRFEVSDTGIGMEKKELDVIFQDFSQFHHNARTRAAGTGLGMPIVKTLTDKMGGAIAIHSEVGVGTVIALRIPFGRRRDHIDTTVQAQVQELSCPAARILVVDDTAVNLKVAAGYLSLADISCDTAESGEEALEKIKAGDYDLIFMDHMMPNMDGIETTKRIRGGDPPWSTLPVIALTANATIETRGMFFEAGMNDFLGKPIDQGELVAILEKWLPTGKVGYKTSLSPVPATAPESARPFLSRVKSIPELDGAAGLKQVGDRVDFYEQTLRLLQRSLPETADRLERGLAESLPKNIVAAAHAIKSSLASVGAIGLSREATRLENAGAREALDECQSSIPPFVRDLRALERRLAGLFAVDGGGDVARAQGDRQALADTLADACECLDAFDGDAALVLLPDLANVTFGPDLDVLLSEARRNAEDFEYERALTAIGAVLDVLNKEARHER